MSALQANNPQAADGRYSVGLARNEDELRRSQRLRYQVFAEELGALLPSASLGLDIDRYDAFCDHLLVWDNDNGDLVSSTRLLNDQQAKAVGGFYSANEFDISPILKLEGGRLEVGRTCVHPAYRNGAAMGMLWKGIGEQMNRRGYRYLIGCASINAQDGMEMIHAISDRLLTKYAAPQELWTKPKLKVPRAGDSGNVTALRLPPLLKAYVGMGAKICGEPCWDPGFRCADVFVLVDVEQLHKRYLRHFFGR
ncbi:MAG: putative hemolysin [Gammaproteobacteria bacterium]|jgi:putative hemolysin